MKKNRIVSIAVLSLALAACDYNAQFEGLEAASTPTDIQTIEYTMTDADYATLAGLKVNTALAGDSLASALAAVKTNKAFSAQILAQNYAPAFLNNLYPTLDNTSSIKLTYNYLGSLPTYITQLCAGKLYTITTADYEQTWGTGAGINYYTPTNSAAAHVPAVLDSAITGPASGDKVMVTYNQAESEQAGTIVAIDEKFSVFNTLSATMYTAKLDGWQNVTVEGTYYWSGCRNNNNGYIQQSANEHQAGALKSYFISSKFLVRDGMKMTFDVAYRNFMPAGGRLSVLISEDYTAGTDSASNVAAANAATWNDITEHFTILYPDSNASNNLTNAGKYDLSVYAGKLVNIAFCYTGDKDGQTSTVQVDNVLVKKEGYMDVVNALYTYNGTAWTAYSNNSLVVLSKSDFVAMGGSYDNFSSSMSPAAYLPIFLAQKYPYAQDGKTVGVAYKYYASSVTSLRADEYVFTDGVWTKNNAIEVLTDQFVKTNGIWTYNPSVVLNLAPVRNEPVAMAYYQAATNWVYNNIDVPLGAADLNIDVNSTDKISGCAGTYYVTSYGNNEYYSGCSAYYNNVDMRPAKAREQYADGYTDMSDEEVIALMEKRLIEVMGKVLGVKNPDAAPIEGIDVTYTVNVGIYTGTTLSGCTHTMVYKVVGLGEFEYVSDSFKAIE